MIKKHSNPITKIRFSREHDAAVAVSSECLQILEEDFNDFVHGISGISEQEWTQRSDDSHKLKVCTMVR